MELLKRHNLEEVEPTTSLQQDELEQSASGQDCTSEAENKEPFRKTVGDLEWLARACRPDLSFVTHSLTQSFDTPTKGQEMQLQKVLAYLKGTQHYSLSLHPTTKITQEEPQLEQLVAFSSTSWTGALEATSTASLNLWGACLIASCKQSGAQTQELAEVESLQLALALASWTRTFLQQLALDKLGDMHISLRTTCWKQELVPGRPLAMLLGLSRRNRHIELDGQLRLSRVSFHKNLAHSLSHNAPEQLMLAKLKIDTEAEEALALSTVRCPGSASFSSCSSLVGMILVVPPQMAPKLRQLALQESCDESLPKPLQSLNLDSLSLLSREECSLTFESLSFASGILGSLILHSLTLIRDRLSSLTLQSLSFREGTSQRETLNSLSFERSNSKSLTLDSLDSQEDRFYRLTLPSLSLREDSFQKMSFKEDSFHNGSLEELEDNLAHKKLSKRAGTNSFSKNSFAEKELAQEVGTNNFEQSLMNGILSFRRCLQIFGLSILLILCAALGLETCFSTTSFQQESLRNDFPQHSLQQEQLVAAYWRMSFEQNRLSKDELEKKLCRGTLECFNQLDLDKSLSFIGFSQNRIRYQSASFSQLDLQISLSFRLLASSSFSNQLQAESFCRTRINTELQTGQVPSFQLSIQQFCLHQVSGGVLRALHQPALQTRVLIAAWTLMSLSLANSWLKTSSNKAWRRRSFRQRLLTACILSSLSFALDALFTSSSLRTLQTTSSRTSLCRRPLSPTASTLAFTNLAYRPAWSFPTTSFRSLVSTRASSPSAFLTTSSLRATSSRRSASMRHVQPTSFRRTLLSIFLVSFMVHNFFFNNIFESCLLGLLHGHLGQEIQSLDQLQDHSFIQKNKKKKKQHLSKAVRDQELAQLDLFQLHHCQLHLLDQPFRGRKQLPEEQSFPSCPLRQMISSFFQKKLERLHLTRSSLTQNLSQNQLGFNQFLAENFGNQLSEQQLQENLSTDQRQLQKKQLTQHSFQQPSSEKPSLEQTTLNKDLATNFAKNSLEDNFVFQTFFFSSLAWQKVASEQLAKNNLDKKQLAKNNLDKKQLAKNNLDKKQLAKNNLDKKQLAKNNLDKKQLAKNNLDKKQLAKNNLDKKHLAENYLYKTQLEKNNFTQTEEEACKEQLLSTGFPKASLDQQLFSHSLVQQSGAKAASHQDLLRKELLPNQLADKNFAKTTLATSLPTRTSARQLQKNQLEEENFTENSLEALCLSSFKALCLSSFQGTACKGALPEQLLHQQLSSRTFQQDSFSTSSFQEESFRTGTFQPTAWSTEPSDRQLSTQQLDRRNLQHQQLGRNNFQDRSFRKNSFDTNTFEKQSFAEKSFAEKSFAEKSFAEKKSFAETHLAEKSFAKKSFATTFAEKSLDQSSALQPAAWKRRALQTPTLQKPASRRQPSKKSASRSTT